MESSKAGACDQCGKVFHGYQKRREQLFRHIVDHTEAQPVRHQSTKKLYRCDYCSYSIVSGGTRDLADHIATKHALKGLSRSRNRDVGQICDSCKAPFRNVQSLRRHLYFCAYYSDKMRFRALYKQDEITVSTTYRNAYTKRGACDECGFKSNTKTVLKHWRSQHSGRLIPPTYYCDSCPFRTSSTWQLQVHLEKHLGFRLAPRSVRKPKDEERLKKKQKNRSLVCENCKASFNSATGMMHHLCGCAYFPDKKRFRALHKSLRQTPLRIDHKVDCDECDYQAPTWSIFKHWRCRHSGLADPISYVCDNCPYQSSTSFSFMSHMKKHPLK